MSLRAEGEGERPRLLLGTRGRFIIRCPRIGWKGGAEPHAVGGLGCGGSGVAPSAARAERQASGMYCSPFLLRRFSDGCLRHAQVLGVWPLTSSCSPTGRRGPGGPVCLAGWSPG